MKIFQLICLLLISSRAYSGASTTAGFPNPSAMKCLALGGQARYVETIEGATGLCKFDEALIGQWTLFLATRTNALTKQDAIEAYLLASQDQSNSDTRQVCEEVGGKAQLAFDKDQKTSLRLCVFPDNSMIEAKTLAYGYEAQRNKNLTRILRGFSPLSKNGDQKIYEAFDVKEELRVGATVKSYAGLTCSEILGVGRSRAPRLSYSCGLDTKNENYNAKKIYKKLTVKEVVQDGGAVGTYYAEKKVGALTCFRERVVGMGPFQYATHYVCRYDKN